MQPSAVVDTVVKYHVFREFTTPIFLAHPQKTGGLWLGMLVVLIPYTSSAYGTAIHPVGKSYASIVDDEKMAFEQRNKYPTAQA